MNRQQRQRRHLPLVFALVALPATMPAGPARAQTSAAAYDVVVYGGTAGGVTAAVQAARMGKRVALVAPEQHLGGMSSGGLSYTDSHWPTSIGGAAADFYRRAGRAYGQVGPEHHFEPQVAERIFDQMVREASIDVFRGERLDLSPAGVAKTGNRIDAIRTEGGRALAARAFIDASYEGDLMAKAGVNYAVGREANSVYGETYNGVQKARATAHQFGVRVDPYVTPGNPASGLLRGISPEPPGADGTGDRRVQAYNFRLTFTKDPANKLPWTQPANYDAGRYELLKRYIQAANITQVSGKLLKITATPIRGNKYDVNNQGGFSTDHIGGNYDYPDADHATRARIVQDHVDYQKGLLYFLATDPELPQSIRNEMNSYGLARDEHADNGNWPQQLYVREARRMVGRYVMTDNNVVNKNGQRVAVDDPVGLGSYTMDSHNAQRYVVTDAQGAYVRNEGDIQAGIPGPYGISYRSITPQEQEASNLLVTGAISASHIAYGSMRMEPVFMILGQSAATAAVQAIDSGTAVQQLDYTTLARRLRADGQMLTWGTGGPAPQPLVGTLREDFNYGRDGNRVDVVSYTHGGWSEPWGGGKNYQTGQYVLGNTPAYHTADQLSHAATGYADSRAPGWLISGGAGTVGGDTASAVVAGRGIAGGMSGTIWISALARIDSHDPGQDALLWLDRTSAGNAPGNAGDAFIGLRKGGLIQLRHSGDVNLNEPGDPTYEAGVTHLLLARLILDEDGGVNDSLAFWIDPDLADLGAPDLLAGGANLFGTTLDGIGISVGPGGGALDAIRISNARDAFAQVTLAPEPAAIGLLAAAAPLLGRRRSRSPASQL